MTSIKGEIAIFLEKNLELIEENINNALLRSGRRGQKVELIAVTKNVDVEIIRQAASLGITDIGENRVQELEGKIKELGQDVKYHMIGHLQTNKVKYIYDKVKLIHSLDRKSLVKELDKRGKMGGQIISSLIQVNVSEEETKFGLKVDELIPFIEEVLKYDNIKVEGLMTIAPHTDNEDELRKIFNTMYKLKEKIEDRNYDNLSMKYLSMGMTNDYELAVEEGSNMVRIGSGIFGSRKY